LFNKQSLKTIVLWVLMILIVFSIYKIFTDGAELGEKVVFSDFERAVKEKAIDNVTISSSSSCASSSRAAARR
jgi:hypothetical protein